MHFANVVFLHLESTFLLWTLRAVSVVRMFLSVRQAELLHFVCKILSGEGIRTVIHSSDAVNS